MDSANAASAASQKKNSSLPARILSAAVLIPLILGMVWWGTWSVATLVAIATVIALREYDAMLSHAGYQPRAGLAVALGLVIVGAFTLRPLFPAFDLVGLAVTLAVCGYFGSEVLRYDGSPRLASWGLSFAGTLYFSWLTSHFILLRGLDVPLRPSPLSMIEIPPGAAWIFMVLAITWLQDTAAYFVGRALGRHKMAPLLSPKKTWEGFAGGLATAVAAGALATYLQGLPITIWDGALIGLLGGLIGPLGDLSVSMIKRQVDMKDSGSLIPGHGGILDRADSLLFVGAATYYLIPLLMH